jgi:hypothetical protein
MKIAKNHKYFVTLPFCALLFFIEALSAYPATFYVATTGSDSNPGTVSQPFHTIARGVNSLNPGDTLFLRGGTYNEAINMTTKTNGSAGNFYTVSGYPGERVILTQMVSGTWGAVNSYYIFDNLILDGAGKPEGVFWTIGNGSHDITLRNLEIKNWFGNLIQVGGGGVGADNVRIINCKLHDNRTLDLPGHRYYGIYWWAGNNGLIDGNDIYNNGGGGVQIYPGPTGNLTVRGNRIHDNNSLTSSAIGGIIVAQTAPITGLKIYNNLIYRNGSSGARQVPGLEIQSGPSGVKVWNNTVYGNAGYGIANSTSNAANNEYRNNISYGNGLSNLYDVGSGTIKDHNLITDPNFKNATALDFTLQTNSPAIDTGASVSEVNIDYNHNPRPRGSAHDIGAYEFGATNGSAPSPPRNLSVR